MYEYYYYPNLKNMSVTNLRLRQFYVLDLAKNKNILLTKNKKKTSALNTTVLYKYSMKY